MAKDLKVDFNGDSNTIIHLDQTVDGKQTTAQKCLINLASVKGSSSLYSEKGTDFLKGVVSGATVNETYSQHICNFAASDTIYFINATDDLDADSPEGLYDLQLTILQVDYNNNVLRCASQVFYPDGTSTSAITELTDTYE